MQVPTHTKRVVRFEACELDLSSGELRKHGIKIRLQEQPFQILTMLLDRPGEVVTREELRERLWPADTFVDFETGLNSAILRLRSALGDSAENSRYIETMPRRGYRFIAAVTSGDTSSAAAPAPPADTVVSTPAPRRLRVMWIAGLAGMAIVLLLAPMVGLNVGGIRERLFTAPRPEIRRLVVLPLANLSGDPSQEYFADGMTNELITKLAGIGSLQVTSLTSAMHYKGTKKSLPVIAQELHVDGVVEGTVTREGNRVRITVQLIYATTDRHLWAHSYERDLSDILRLQSEVAQAIATEIQIKLSPREQVHLAESHPVNPAAYEAHLKGRYFWNKRTLESIRKGMEYFEEAIRVDPSYAPAYAGVADSYVLLSFPARALSAEESARLGRAAATRALELDENLAEAHASLAIIKSRYDWDWAGAEREYQRALELDPSYSTSYLRYGGLLSFLGRTPEGLAMHRRGLRVDPLSPALHRAVATDLAHMGQYDQAEELFQKALELEPGFFPTHRDLSYMYTQMGKHEDAIAEARKALELSGGNPSMRALLGRTYAVAGFRVEAEKILRELKKHPGLRLFSYELAFLCAALGRKDEAFAWLEEAFEDRSFSSWSARPFFWDPLRSDPRFKELQRRLMHPEVKSMN